MSFSPSTRSRYSFSIKMSIHFFEAKESHFSQHFSTIPFEYLASSYHGSKNILGTWRFIWCGDTRRKSFNLLRATLLDCKDEFNVASIILDGRAKKFFLGLGSAWHLLYATKKTSFARCKPLKISFYKAQSKNVAR